MKLTNAELIECKKALENETLSFIKSNSTLMFRIFVNGNDDISFWVSDKGITEHQVMTVSREMFYQVFDVQMCNKVLTALKYRYSRENG